MWKCLDFSTSDFLTKQTWSEKDCYVGQSDVKKTRHFNMFHHVTSTWPTNINTTSVPWRVFAGNESHHLAPWNWYTKFKASLGMLSIHYWLWDYHPIGMKFTLIIRECQRSRSSYDHIKATWGTSQGQDQGLKVNQVKGQGHLKLEGQGHINLYLRIVDIILFHGPGFP